MVLPPRLPRGFVLGDYAIDGWIRDGSMSAIYRAHRITDQRCVAVKLQLPLTTRDPAVGERFEREAEVLWRVRGNAHVVELLDVGMLDDGRRYLVMKWLDGQDFDELLDFLHDHDHPLSVVGACRIARDVALGLGALHEHGVVHLDLEPAHVVVRCVEDGVDDVTLVDFGHAADLRGLGQPADMAQGGALGSIPAYVAPERARGGAPSPACDIYALGVLLFETLSGACLPADGWSPETLPRVDALRHGVPPALAELVCVCMSREIGQRPASARAVATVLEAIIGALEAGASHGHGRPTAMPPQALRTGDTLVGMAMPLAAASHGHGRPTAMPEEELRTGDTLVGMVMPLAGARIMAPARSGCTEATLPPFLRDEPPAQSGDTLVSLVPPPSIDELQLRTTMKLTLAEDEPWPEDTAPTFELEPVRATEPLVDPDDTEVAMKLDPGVWDEPPADPDDTAVLTVVEPAREAEPWWLGLLESSIEELPPTEHDEASTSDREWLAQEKPWWLRWMVAAGVLLALGGTGAWLVQRSEDVDAKATSAVTASTMAASTMGASTMAASAMGAEAKKKGSPAASSREDAQRSTNARAGVETRAATRQPSIASPMQPRREGIERAEADEQAPAVAASKAACADVRAQADAGKRTREWVSVLKATRKRSCWSSRELRVARARLRVTAFAELGELERCVAEGSKSRDHEIAARTALCRKELQGEAEAVEAEVVEAGADVTVDG
jgi:serine/threonine protein kinase